MGVSLAVNCLAVAAKVALVDPAGMATEDGTVRLAEVDDRLTLETVEALTVTVQVLAAPGESAVGVQASELTAGRAASAMVAPFEVPFSEAVTVGVSLTVNCLAAAAKVALVDPAGIATEGGTVRLVELDDRLTLTPVEALTVTVQVLAAPGESVVGVQASELTAGRVASVMVAL